MHLASYKGQFVAVKLVPGASFPARAPPPSHANLVKVLERFVTDSGFCEVRALCSGGELYDRIAEEGALALPEALGIFAQLTSAVAHSHACGVAHGQLRPEHVLLGASDEIQLLGFVNPSPAGGVSAADTTRVALRPARPLDAPEWHENGGVSACAGARLPPADVWAVCVHLLVMVSGQQPFSAADPQRCPRYAAFVRTADLSALIGPAAAAALPAWLMPLVTRALQPMPAHRPTAAELLLAVIANGGKASWTTPPMPPPMPPLCNTTIVPGMATGAPLTATCEEDMTTLAAAPVAACTDGCGLVSPLAVTPQAVTPLEATPDISACVSALASYSTRIVRTRFSAALYLSLPSPETSIISNLLQIKSSTDASSSAWRAAKMLRETDGSSE